MAYKFKDDWAEEVAELTDDPQYQKAVIRIFKPSRGDYNLDTGQWEGVETETLYEGRARLIGVRWGVYQQSAASMNSRVDQAARVQIPKDAVGRVLTGWSVKILEAPKNPSLVGRVLTITNDFQGSSSATRSFECGFDNDSQAPA